MARSDEAAKQTEPEAKLPLAKLAARHGQISPAMQGEDGLSAAHASASILNGWAHIKRAQGIDVELTDAQYIGAIEAAKVGKSFDGANFSPAKKKAK